MTSMSNSSIFCPWMTVRPMPRIPGLISRSGMIAGRAGLDCAQPISGVSTTASSTTATTTRLTTLLPPSATQTPQNGARCLWW